MREGRAPGHVYTSSGRPAFPFRLCPEPSRRVSVGDTQPLVGVPTPESQSEHLGRSVSISLPCPRWPPPLPWGDQKDTRPQAGGNWVRGDVCPAELLHQPRLHQVGARASLLLTGPVWSPGGGRHPNPRTRTRPHLRSLWVVFSAGLCRESLLLGRKSPSSGSASSSKRVSRGVGLGLGFTAASGSFLGFLELGGHGQSSRLGRLGTAQHRAQVARSDPHRCWVGLGLCPKGASRGPDIRGGASLLREAAQPCARGPATVRTCGKRGQVSGLHGRLPHNPSPEGDSGPRPDGVVPGRRPGSPSTGCRGRPTSVV